MKTDRCTAQDFGLSPEGKMPIYNTMTDLVLDLCVPELTKGEEMVGRTRLGSFFQESWMTAPYGSAANHIIRPTFQRDSDAWPLPKQRGFIQRILAGVSSLGHFIILNCREDNTYSLLDGQHRLTTVQKFIRGDFNLGTKKTAYAALPEAQKETLNRTVADVKIYYHLTAEEEREKYIELNSASALSAGAKLHALRAERPQAIYKLIDLVRHNDEGKESYAKICELFGISSETGEQAATTKLIAPLAILAHGPRFAKKSELKKCVEMEVSESTQKLVELFAQAVKTLDSSKSEMTRFVGPIATDLYQSREDEEELAAVVKRWDALIRHAKRDATVEFKMTEGRANTNSASEKEFVARCEVIRTLYDENGEFIGPIA